MTYWTDAELGLRLKEAIRTWNAYALQFKARCAFSTTATQLFYALPTQAGIGSGTGPVDLLAYSLTDQDILQQIQYDLLEPVSATSWPGTEQFNLVDVSNAISRRRDQFLLETGLVITHSTMNLPSPPASGRVTLDDAIIDVRQAMFLNTDTPPVYTNLWQTDEWDSNTLTPDWSFTAGTSDQYSVVIMPPTTLQLIPIPIDAGTLDLLTVNAGTASNPAVGVALGIPDDLAWVVRFGVLADLLGQDGPARDAARAQYCEARWQEGLMLAQKVFATALNADLNGVPIIIESLEEAQTLNPNWMNSSGQPTQLFLIGDTVCLSPIADGNGPYSVGMDVLRNAPVPALDADFIQVGREIYDAIEDYAVHLAAFKMAGPEFGATTIAYQRFVRLAAQNNARLRAQATFFEPLYTRRQQEERRQPRREEEEGVTA